MKFYIAVVVLVGLLAVHFSDAASLERRLKDTNSFQRKLKGCNMLCKLKNVLRRNGQGTCYYLPSKNVTVSECAWACLQVKGEKLEDAQRCTCVNGVCTDLTTTPASTSAGTTPASTTPASTTPASTTPAGTTPAGTTPAGTTPAGTTPAGTTPAGTTPAGTTIR